LRVLEFRRQVLHVLFGASAIGVGLFFGALALKACLFACVLAGAALITLQMLGVRVPLSHRMFELFERKTAEMPGKGALLFVVGTFFLACFSPSLEFTLAVIGILGFGDEFATIVGVNGMHPLPFNKKKSWEGTLAFFAAGFASSAFFVGVPQALTYTILLGLVEAADSPADDNLLIPLTAIILKGFGV